MKKLGLTSLFVCAFVLVLSLSSAAIEISGGYLNGTIVVDDDSAEANGNGFTASGQVGLVGPLGVMINFTSFSSNEFDVFASDALVPGSSLAGVSGVDGNWTHVDLAMTCALPIPGVQLKAFGGYAISKLVSQEGTEEGFMYKGPIAGLIGTLALGDKFAITGSYGLGIGTEVGDYYDGEFAAAPDDVKANMATYQLGATYRVVANISLEAGLTGFNYGWEQGESDFTQKLTGYYIGARADF